MKPLAYLMRPKSFDDIVGQDNLVGPNGVIRKMVDNNHLFSLSFMEILAVAKPLLRLLLVRLQKLNTLNLMPRLIVKIF